MITRLPDVLRRNADGTKRMVSRVCLSTLMIALIWCHEAKAGPEGPEESKCGDIPSLVEYVTANSSRNKVGFVNHLTIGKPRFFLEKTIKESASEVMMYDKEIRAGFGSERYYGPVPACAGRVEFRASGTGSLAACLWDSHSSHTLTALKQVSPVEVTYAGRVTLLGQVIGLSVLPPNTLTSLSLRFIPDPLGEMTYRIDLSSEGAIVNSFGIPLKGLGGERWMVTKTTVTEQIQETTYYTPAMVRNTLSQEYTTTLLRQRTLSFLNQSNYPVVWSTWTTNSSNLTAFLRVTATETNCTAQKVRARVSFASKPGEFYKISWEEASSEGPVKKFQTGVRAEEDQTVYDQIEIKPPDGSKDGTWTLQNIRVKLAENCARCEAGKVEVSIGSFNLNLDMGSTVFGKSAGKLWIEEATASAALSTPAALQFLDYGNGVEVIRDGNGWIRQIKAPQLTADIVVVDAYSYRIRLFTPGSLGLKVDGVYTFTGNPHSEWLIANPDASPDSFNRLQITEFSGAHAVSTRIMTAIDGGWTLEYPNLGYREIETSTNVTEAGQVYRIDTREVRGGTDNQLLRKRVRKWAVGSFGTRLVQETQDPDGLALTTSYSYYPGNQLQSVLRYDGSWERYVYDSAGRMLKRVQPYLNSAITDPDSASLVTEYSYTNSVVAGSGDTGLTDSVTPRRTVWYVSGQGFTNSLGYQVILPGETRYITAIVPGAAWNNPGNLITITKTFTNGPFKGEVESVSYPDGRLELHDYATNELGTLRTNTVWSGEANANKTEVVKGIKTVQVVDLSGQEQSVTSYDIESGKLVGFVAYSQFDELNRPQRISHLDGSFETQTYACCGLETSVDRFGVATTYTYDELKRVTSTTRAGITQITRYNAAGDVIREIRQGTDGSQMTLIQNGYDRAGRLIATTNASGAVTTFSTQYDASGQTIRTTTTAAGTAYEGTRIEASARDGSLLKVTGTAVHGVRYFRNGLIQRSIQLDAAGNDGLEWTETETDISGRGVATRSSLSASEVAEARSYYNSKGQLIREVMPDGVVRLFAYNSLGEVEYSALDMDRDGVIDFDGTDRISQTVNDVVSAHGLDVIRNRTYVWSTNSVDARLLTSTSERSVDGLRSWTYGFGLTNESRLTYGPAGTWYTTNMSPNGSYLVSHFENGYKLSVTARDANDIQLSRTEFAYDTHGRQIRVTDARSGISTISYDVADRPVTVRTPAPGDGQPAQTTTSIYDLLDRPIRVIQPDGGVVTNEYHLTGELKRTAGSRVYPVDYIYDDQGRLRTHTTWRNTTAGTGAASTRWNYDAYNGFLTNKAYADGQGPVYTYHTAGGPKGRMQKRRWARGIETAYTYNNAGEVVGIDYSDATPDVSVSFNRLGQPAQVIDGTNTVAYAYNTAGQLISESNNAGILNGLAVSSGYDALLRRSNLELRSPNAQLLSSTTYAYDSAGRLKTVNGEPGTANGVSATYDYIPNSPLIGTIRFTNNGQSRMTTTKSYDLLNRLTHIQSDSSSFSSSSSYTYNAANQRTKATLADGSYWVYEYDKLGQVTAGRKYWANGTAVDGQEFGYAFDDIGNRTASARNTRVTGYDANELNQYNSRNVPGFVDITGTAATNSIVTVNRKRAKRTGEYYHLELGVTNAFGPVWLGVTNWAVRNNGTNADIVADIKGNVYVPPAVETFAHDADGNLVADSRWYYNWDGENRLISMETSLQAEAAGVPKRRIEYLYDYRSRRTQKKVFDWNNVWIAITNQRFIYDGWNLIAVLNPDSSLQQSFTWGLDLSQSLQGAGGVGGLIAIRDTATGKTSLPAYDGNGNIMALIDAATGQETARYEYGPFGELIRSTGPAAPTNPFRFSTKYQDNESGLLYYGYRYYDSVTGRWLSRDPLGETASSNPYGMIRNKIANSVDILGLYEPGGHFWMVYMIARSAGKDPQSAFQEAYYAQLADQLVATDAASLWYAMHLNDSNPAIALWSRRNNRRKEIARFLNNSDTVSDQDLEGWAKATYNWIHSLHGGNDDQVRKRRECLKRMLADASLQPWERGMVMHAFGDSYAHVKKNGDGHVAYGWPDGHGADSAKGVLGARSEPDIVSNFLDRYGDYTKELYSVMSGKDKGAPLPIQLERTVFYARWSGSNERAWMKIEATGFYRYNFDYEPMLFNTHSDFYKPNRQDIEAVMEKIKDACLCK